MVKQKISITIDEDMIKLVDNLLVDNPIFRNRSHVIEYGLNIFLRNNLNFDKLGV